MKQPKLKNYFVAISPDEYVQFEQSRELAVKPATIDIMTGSMTGRPFLYLSARPDIADNIVREHYRYSGPVFILRVAAEYVDRGRLRLAEGATQTWQYDQSLRIPECGVYRYEMPE